MISYLGNFAEDAIVYIMFNTFTSNDPSASCTITNFVNTDVHIHKDDGLTQRNNAAGITVSVDFDGITGSHMIKIDTSDNTVAGFWIAGHEYFVRIEGTAIDGATINSVVGQFSIENRHNEVDVVKISGDATAANNAELTFDGTGYGFANCIMPVVTALTGHTVQTGDNFTRIGAPVGASISADLIAIEAYVDELESRLSAARAGYLDNLSAGAVALASGVDLTKIHGVALTETVNGYLAAAFVKLFDVASPLLVASEVMRGTDSAYTGTPPTAAAIVNEWESQSQADPTGFHVNVKEINGTGQTANDNGADINNILSDTNELQTDWVNGGRLDLILDIIAADTTIDIPALIAALENISSANVTTACTSSLNTYDPPTRTEATSDKAAIITEVNANETKIDTLQTDSTAIKAKTDSLPSGIAKNVALPKFDFLMVLSSDGTTGATGKTVTGKISKDCGSFATLTNSITEISDGMYAMLTGLTQAEMNCDVFTLIFSATGCLDRVITIHTT